MSTTTQEQIMHEVCVTARAHEACARCGALPGAGCRNASGGMHLRRAVAARLDELVSETAIGEVFHMLGMFSDSSIIPDGGLS